MAFKLEKHTQDALVAGERLYLTADKQTVVKEGDAKAAFLLAPKGGIIPGKVVKALKLTASGTQHVEEDDAKTKSTRVEHPKHR